MAKELTAADFRERARRVREDWVDMGVQIERLKERREQLGRDARVLERNAEKLEELERLDAVPKEGDRHVEP